jgi:hypothetical protein
MQDGAKLRLKIGIAGMVISLLLWPLLAGVAFLPFSTRAKAVLGIVLFVFIEVLFWGGAVLAGKEAAQRYRDKLDPRTWFRKSTPPPPDDQD